MTPGWVSKLDQLASILFQKTSYWPDRKIVHDTVWGTRAFEGWEVAIMDLPLLQRLRNIHQTSLAYLTFPTALHTRFDHSLGVCSGTKELASKVLHLDDDVMYCQLTAAALLHDIGHGPFSHLSEDAYAARSDLFANLTYATPEDSTIKYPDGSPHEVIGALLLQTPAAREFFALLNEHYGVHIEPEHIGEIIAGNRGRETFTTSSLVNGPFDADKIDYLRRDSVFSGVPIALDFDRLVHSLEVKQDEELDERVVAINVRGVVSAEQILFGKATLYSTVYHHHKVRAADCLFKAIIERMFETGEGIDGDNFEDPADMLRFVDSDFTKWIARKPDADQIPDPRVRHILDLLARRELPVRILEISTHSVEDEGLQELFRFRNPGPARANQAYQELLDLRREIAAKVGEQTDDPNFCEDEVWVDLPHTPKLGDGTLIDRSDKLRSLSEVFPTGRWVDYYKQHRYTGYVLGPRRHRDAVRTATEEIFSQRGIVIKQK